MTDIFQPKNSRLVFWLIPLVLAAGLVFLNDRSIAARLGSVEIEAAPLPLAHLVSALPPPTLGTRAFISSYLGPDGQIKVLAEENARERWPIASITKLFTAAVLVDGTDLDQTVTLTETDLPETEDSGLFHAGETFRVGDLLLPLLLQSSNNAAVALSHLFPSGQFIARLNALAAALNLSDTKLYNPNGLDPVGVPGANYSSVYDLTLLAKWLIEKHPELLALTRQPQATLDRADGNFHHEISSTNQLLVGETWSTEIVGGKTGSTDLAGKNLLLILREPKTGGYLINVVLGAGDHFGAMRELVDWVTRAYQFAP